MAAAHPLRCLLVAVGGGQGGSALNGAVRGIGPVFCAGTATGLWYQWRTCGSSEYVRGMV
ncbi:protein of unknown function [Trichlorobacter ammonificans]|uniref:Uncharacterized protein n=1 Tax=Trichlorobacter ammonificans TaxID=2916410 RepID=A0ABM9DA98_9BACT|nr:protein of unknown function [Trichlorobacter ammonificans]